MSGLTGASAQARLPEVRATMHALAGDDLKAFLGFTPAIEVVDLPIANAMARKPNRITLTTGLLKLLRDRDELAFVLAHELGHLKEGGDDALGGEISEHEVSADMFAVGLLRQAGLEQSAGSSALRRVLNNQLTVIGPNHPTCRLLIERIRRLNSIPESH